MMVACVVLMRADVGGTKPWVDGGAKLMRTDSLMSYIFAFDYLTVQGGLGMILVEWVLG